MAQENDSHSASQVPNDERDPIVSPFSVFIDPGSAPQELITDFFIALSAAYRAHGGSGLQIVNDEYRSLVGEEVL